MEVGQGPSEQMATQGCQQDEGAETWGVNSEGGVVREVTFEPRPDGRRDKVIGRALQAEGTAKAKALRLGRGSGARGTVDVLEPRGLHSEKAVR